VIFFDLHDFIDFSRQSLRRFRSAQAPDCVGLKARLLLCCKSGDLLLAAT
jgi:hypothetical protein